MSGVEFQKPVENSVDKVNNEVAVGEDLDFQRVWWKFERFVWSIFVLIILCDLAGLFGRGPLSHAQMQNRSMRVKYERIERYGTPSMLSIALNPEAVGADGKFHLFVSESLVNELGTQRVIPSPEQTTVGDGGLSYTFPASPGMATVEFATQPAKAGRFEFSVQVPGDAPLYAHVFVMP